MALNKLDIQQKKILYMQYRFPLPGFRKALNDIISFASNLIK
jgi:hypothetical protein